MTGAGKVQTEMAKLPSTAPMSMTGIENFIDRAYRESTPHQWVREAYINATEASAGEVYFGVEWQAVRSQGVYRRLIVDDGISIDADKLPKFFNTFGGSGKPIGDYHENYGVGFKTSVLPWNPYGVVVVAFNGEDAAMTRIWRDPETGEFGMKYEQVEDENGDVSLETIYEPFDDEEHGCNWADIWPWPDKPKRGVAIVLLGEGPDSDTVMGDLTRNEGRIDDIPRYLNGRIWELPLDQQVKVLDFKRAEKAEWGTGESQSDAQGTRRWQNRNIYGQKYYLERVAGDVEGGEIVVDGGRAKILWYLHPEGTTEYVTVANQTGFVATLHHNELYDRSASHNAFWRFGITEPLVRKRLALIIEPAEFDKATGYGAYTNHTRSTLLYGNGVDQAKGLPYSEWGAQFADKMPQPIIDAIRAERAKQKGGSITDEAWRKKLAERFGARWRTPRLRVDVKGTIRGMVVQSGETARRPVKHKIRKRSKPSSTHINGGQSGAKQVGIQDKNGDAKLKEVSLGVALPDFCPAGADTFSPGMLALWSPKEPGYPNGCVFLNVEHLVIEEEILEWQKQYPQAHAEIVREEVIDAYGQVACAHIAHSEHMRGIIGGDTIDQDLRSQAALTMALLGLWPIDGIIRQRLSAKLPRVA